MPTKEIKKPEMLKTDNRSLRKTKPAMGVNTGIEPIITDVSVGVTNFKPKLSPKK